MMHVYFCEGDKVQIFKVDEPDKLEYCLDRCEGMCCGRERKGAWKLPTCAIGCLIGSETQNQQSCFRKCDAVKNEKKCDLALENTGANLCQDCGCKPEDHGCVRGCQHFFYKEDFKGV